MLGAYLVLATASLFNGEPVMALGAAILLSLVVGGLVYVFLMRKMTGEMVLAAILTTVALGILIRGLVVLVWSAQQQYPAQALGVPNPSLVLFRRRAHLAVVGGPGRHQCRRLRRAVLLPALRPLGHAHACRRTEPAARRAARHQPARRLCAGLEPVDAHRRARRHPDGARFRADRQHAGDRAQGVSRPRWSAGSTASPARWSARPLSPALKCCSSITSIRCCPTWCRSWC